MFKRKLNIVVLVLCIIVLLSAFSVFAEDLKVKLNLFERLVVMQLLPQKGSFATLKIVTELNMELGASDEEYILAGLEPQDDGSVQAKKGWLSVPEKEFTFKEAALSMIRASLQMLDDAEQLTMEHFRVYEKFMIVEEKKEE